MDTSSAESSREVRSPTLPLPPPAAASIEMETFIESATRAVLRAVASGLNPQPLPPKEGPVGAQAAVAPLNPQPLPPGDIIVGIIYTPRDVLAAAVRPPTAEL